MGKLTLHTSSHSAYYYFKDKIIEYLSADTQGSFIYLLPVNRAVRYLKKKLVAEFRYKSVLEPPLFSFRSLFKYLYNYAPVKKKIISPAMRLLILEHILNNNENRLNYFPHHMTFGNGLIIKAESMIEEFFQFGFRPEDFKNPPPFAEKKFADFGYLISGISNSYQDRLIDESSLISEVIHLLKENIIPDAFPDLKTVYISGFGIYSPPMYEFIKHMKVNYEVEIKLEFDADNQELFKHTADAYEHLSRMSDEIIKIDDDAGRLGKHMFMPIAVDYHKEDIPFNVEIHTAHDRSAEIHFIAAKIKQLHHLDNIPLDEIGITFPDLEKYVPLIIKIFNDYKIPFNLSTGFNLAESPLIQSFIQVVRVVVSRFEVDEVYKLMLSPFLKQNLAEEADLIRVSAGKIHLNYFQVDWEQKIRALFNTEKNIDAFRRINRKISGEKLDELLGRITALLSSLKPLIGKHSAEEFKKTYIDVLKMVGLLDWYDHDHGLLSIREREKEFRAFNQFIKLMDQIVWIIQYIHGSDFLEIQDYFNAMTIVFENSTYNLREWSDHGVQIMPRLEILSLELNTFFIGGLVEGDFPRHFTKDIFFSDEERAIIGLNASEDLLGQDRFLFYQLITSGAKNLQLYYPDFENEKKLLQSTFLTNVQEIISSVKIIKNSPDTEFISRSSLPEYLSKSLKSGIRDTDKSLYALWMNNEQPVKVRYWQNGIRSLYARRSYRQVTRSEGNLTDIETVRSKLDEVQMKHPFSITALESYAFCPMQYFLQRILHLEPDEERTVTLTSLEKGNVIHKVLYRFYHQLTIAERKKPWEHKDLLLNIAEDILKAFPYDDILWIVEKERFFGSPSAIGLWEKFLDNEKEYIQQSGFLPVFFELDFEYMLNEKSMTDSSQLKGANKNSRKSKIYGKIDRIDMDEKDRFVVLDYKSGQGAMKINVKDMLNGSSLQLPVYLAAAENILSKKEGHVFPAAGIYYQVQDGERCTIKIVLINGEYSPGLVGSKEALRLSREYRDSGRQYTFSDVIRQALNHISRYIDEIATGNFRHTSSPRDIRCTSYCPYNRICRKDVGKLLSLQEES